MKVLVTGGCGMIGFHIARYYRNEGHDVVIMDNLERSRLLGHEVDPRRKYYNKDKLVEMGCTWWSLDISNRSHWSYVTDDFDAIFHMAAQCGVPTSIEGPVRDFEVNTTGTIHMLEHARKCNARVVYASTNKIYPIHGGWYLDRNEDRWRWMDRRSDKYGFSTELGRILPEDSRTPYGNSKLMGEMLCREWHHTYGVPVGCFRMSCIYGDHQFGFEEQGWATWFAIATLKGEPINIYGDGRQVRDMLWVGDLVRAYNAFIVSGTVDFGVWNMGGGVHNTLSLNESLELLAVTTGRRSPVVHGDWRPSDQRIYTSDIRPVKNDLNWRPTVSPEKGLKRVVEWAKDNLEVF